MKAYKVETRVEQLILTGMIISDRFLQEVQQMYRPELIEVPAVKIVSGWCIDFYKKQKKAPGKDIQSIYDSAVREGLDKDRVESIERFLLKASTEYERADKLNVSYLLDVAEKRFKEVSLRHLAEDINTLLLKEDVKGAEE